MRDGLAQSPEQAFEVGHAFAQLGLAGRGRQPDYSAALASSLKGWCRPARPRRADYIARSRQRLNYPAFRAAGLCVATGVGVGTCKNLVVGRLKRGDLHWSVNGDNAILAPSLAWTLQ